MVRIITLVALLSVAAMAQDYGFSVPEFSCTATVNEDRSLSISYDIVFSCQIGRRSIDIVDIGFPTDEYLLGSVTASIDEYPLHGIYPSEYIDTGVEVHLGGRAIRQGTSGRFRCSGINPELVFLDAEKDGYASVEFTPTWFDGGILSGESSFRLEIVFPEGALPDDVFFHGLSFTDSFVDQNGRIVYVWEDVRRVDSAYNVGISFPAGLVAGPLRERPKKPLLSPAAISLIITFFIFFLVFASIVLVIILSVRRARRRREQYLPPTIGLEGSSVRRGLTAPMAALLLEEKLDRVFLMIVFGLIRKGALQLDDGALRKTGSTEGLRSYESALLSIIPERGRVPEDGVESIFLGMIKELEEKMEGYSLRETRQYYESIIRSAWKMVESDQSTARAGEILGDMFQWLLADSDFDSKIDGIPEDRMIHLPSFMHGFFTGSFVSGTPKGISLGSACSQVAGFLETSAGRMVSNITGLSRTVTATTNPMPVASSSYRGSSGSSCACACACAGCACACAGGGR